MVVFADDSHFVGAAVADRFVVALAESDELGFLGAEDALDGHVEILNNVITKDKEFIAVLY